MQTQFPLILHRKFKLGLIVNAYAGLGGSVGLKGSDGSATVQVAFERGAEFRAPARAKRTLQLLKDLPIEVFCFAGELGEDVALSAGLAPEVIGSPSSVPSTAADTKAAATQLRNRGVDLILFVGGDGTARNIYKAVGSTQAVLGVPSGVKMHSGVYAIAPEAAAEVIIQLNRGELVSLSLCEVRDIDEALFRKGQVQSKYYGELLGPSEPRYVQAVKQGGREVEALVLDDIAADVIESMEADTLYIFAPGSTTFAITDALGLEASLLGVDLVLDKHLIAKDLAARALQDAVFSHPGPVKLVITAIGGQGHIIGRGNQQLTPELLEKIGKENLIVVATKTKLEALSGRPLLIDSNDPVLDGQWQGYIPVITGYRDCVLYPLGYGAQHV